MSAQGVVERASAELTKRINGLALRSKHHAAGGQRGGKGSVMERVTSALCGSSNVPPDKPSRCRGAKGSPTPQPQRRLNANDALSLSWDELWHDERFLAHFFAYFTPGERRVLARVCTRWRDVLYRSPPRCWAGLLPVVRCRELRLATPADRARLYASLLRRGFHAVALLGATDEDALDLVHSFPLAAKHVHSLSLRCSSVSDRGLEALLDHLQ
ncbi:hypothetical protein LSTR_LSTR016784, partial [Laodelphax striatellus]